MDPPPGLFSNLISNSSPLPSFDQRWTTEYWRSDYFSEWNQSRRLTTLIMSDSNKSTAVASLRRMTMRCGSFQNVKHLTTVRLLVVPCPPVVEVLIRRPDTKYQVGTRQSEKTFCSFVVVFASAWFQCTEWHRKSRRFERTCTFFSFPRSAASFGVALPNAVVSGWATASLKSIARALSPRRTKEL